MPSSNVTAEQVMDLVQQMPPEQERALFNFLLRRRQQEWQEAYPYFEEGARRTAAERGRNWDAMTEEEREDFIDEIVHEDRPCSGS